MEKEAFEPTGLIPRSIIRTVDRFVQQLLPGKEKIALQEYRVSRYQILVSIKSLALLVLIPLLLNSTVKALVFTPLIEHFWNSRQAEIFLNQYQEKRAFSEMHDFSEKMFFESLLIEPKGRPVLIPSLVQQDQLSPSVWESTLNGSLRIEPKSIAFLQSSALYKSPGCRLQAEDFEPSLRGCSSAQKSWPYKSPPKGEKICTPLPMSLTDSQIPAPMPIALPFLGPEQGDVTDLRGLQNEALYDGDRYQKLFQIKSLELAKSYNKQSILAITNLLGDFLTFFIVWLLIRIMRPQLIILKSFLTESVYSLSDTTKSFLLILGMDLLVGFHSPRGWELALEGFLRHIGLPENENFILLFVALFPVFLDTVFKYWIFRYLNKISPSTVVTYHSMIE